MKAKLLFVLFIGIVLSGYAQQKYSNEFLTLGIGARGLAMANTMCAITDDVTSAYWNPAGLSRMDKRYALSLMHAEYFAGIAKYDYAGIGYKIDEHSAVALSYIRFGVDNIMNTTELIDAQGNIDYDRITYFSTADNALLLSYAYRFGKVQCLSLGGNAKIIQRSIGKFARAWGFGLDLGLQYHLRGWQIGVMLRDATSTFNAWRYFLSDRAIEVFEQTGNEIPRNDLELTLPSLQIGGAKYVNFSKKFNATFALNLDCTFDGKRNVPIRSKVLCIDPRFGMELGYKHIVHLRAGIGNFQQEIDFDGTEKTSLQINIGVGICIRNFLTIDYALTDLGDLAIGKYSNIFSLKLTFDCFKKQKSKP